MPLPPIPADALAGLSRFERLAVRLAHRQSRGARKRLWSAAQRTLGARWIGWAMRHRVHAFGLEPVARLRPDRPVLVVANHRSYFDLYVVAALLWQEAPWLREVTFPVRGRFFYQHPLGLLVNAVGAWWAMWPPFFAQPAAQGWNRWALDELVAQAGAPGGGRLVGFHPEGTRNRSDDPWSLLPAQPGVGKLVHEARPIVVPAFIGGLGNRFLAETVRHRRNGPPVRLWFGPPIDAARWSLLPARARSYVTIANELMAEVRALGERDRGWIVDRRS